MATILCEQTRPQMGTICPGAFRKPEPDFERTAEVLYETVDLSVKDDVRLVAQILNSESNQLDISEADIIVAGGRGMGSADAEWIDQKSLVGQTGKLVRPKLYIACGISGALQHVVGMVDSGCIVAINSDPSAPIFDIADYAVVGDVKEILPSFTRFSKVCWSNRQPRFLRKGITPPVHGFIKSNFLPPGAVGSSSLYAPRSSIK